MGDDLTPFRTQQLFVIVGTNPLPNYVAAQLLLAPPSSTTPPPARRLYLVHTHRTDRVADRLLALFPDVAVKVVVDETNAAHIHAQVQAYVGSGSVGLHYTGGTKAMAVHAYQALREKRADVICSYLDARTLSLQIDHPPDPSNHLPIGLAIQPTFETLLALHGHEINPDKPEPVSSPQHLDCAQAIVAAGCGRWRNWCSGHLHRGGRLLTEEDGVASVKLPSKESHPFLAGLLPCWAGCQTIGALARQWDTTVKDVTEWLDGKWLEHYTLRAVQDVAARCDIHFAKLGIFSRSIPLQPSSEGLSRVRKFEIDVAALRGYRLFSLSCGTAEHHDRLKLKFFEAYVRARQLGGDEARVGLVCCAEKGENAKIQREIENEWDAQGVVRVFGAEDLRQLSAHLKTWFLTGT